VPLKRFPWKYIDDRPKRGMPPGRGIVAGSGPLRWLLPTSNVNMYGHTVKKLAGSVPAQAARRDISPSLAVTATPTAHTYQ
jgi:hypothetical protein